MDVKAKLELLRGMLPNIPARESLPSSFLPSGIPKSALTEISGSEGGGKTEFILSLLSENLNLRVAWIEKELTAYPWAFLQCGIELHRVLFVESGAQALWCALQVLRSQLFDVVVVNAFIDSEKQLRRLQLESEKVRASVLFLSQEPRRKQMWPLALQLSVSRQGTGLKIETLKSHHLSEGAKSWAL